MIQRILEFFRQHYLLNSDLKRFLYHNDKYWQTLHQAEKKNKFILVDLLVDHPGYLIGNCVAANYLKNFNNAEVVGLVRNRLFNKTVEIAKSYGIRRCIYVDSLPNKLRFFINSKVFSSNIKLDTRKSLLDLHINNIKIGDLVYDTFLKKTGYGTLTHKKTIRKFICEAFYYFKLYEKIFSSINVIATVQGHIVYNSFGILARVAVNKGCTVYARKPASGPMTIKRCTSMDDLLSYELRVDPDEFKQISHSFYGTGVRRGQDYMQKRFYSANDITDSDAVTAFSKNKKNYVKQDLMAKLGLRNNNNPIVCIMSHIFPDAPHSNCWMLYDDYYLWLIDTLKSAKKVKHVNWLLKEHPSVKYYNPKQTAKQALKDICSGIDNIKMIPDDLNSASLVSIVDAIVTVRGTAGLEFSTFGIPCILAGDSPYSGYGFTIEPQTRNEYTNLLQSIDTVHRLTKNQIDMAKFITFLIYCYFKVDCVLVPEIQAVFWKNFNEKTIWNDALMRLKAFSPEADPLFRSMRNLQNLNLKRTYNPIYKKHG